MDFNQIPFGFGFAYPADRMALDHASNMSDDEKKEYIERHRSGLSKKELDQLTASIREDEDDGPDLSDEAAVFKGPGIG